MKTFNVQKQQKLSTFLIENYNGEISYSAVMKLFRKKDVKVNGIRVNKDVTVCVGDEVCSYYNGEKQFALTEVYCDANLLIVDKPSGITSEDFEARVKTVYKTAELCHRLDRNTDGLLCFSLNAAANEELLKAFKDRTVKKYYLAEIYGSFDKKSDTLTAYLVKDSINSQVKIYKKKVDDSVKIVTAYKTLKESGGTSLVEVELVTGKTHQIRAHLAYEGHFIIGDGKYGNNKINAQYKAKTQKLTSYRIAFYGLNELSYLNGKEFKLDRVVYGITN